MTDEDSTLTTVVLHTGPAHVSEVKTRAASSRRRAWHWTLECLLVAVEWASAKWRCQSVFAPFVHEKRKRFAGPYAVISYNKFTAKFFTTTDKADVHKGRKVILSSGRQNNPTHTIHPAQTSVRDHSTTHLYGLVNRCARRTDLATSATQAVHSSADHRPSTKELHGSRSPEDLASAHVQGRHHSRSIWIRSLV